MTTTSTPSHDTAVTMTTTASQLARGFGIIIRQIADLLTMLQDYHALAPGLPRTLDISDQEALDLQVFKAKRNCGSLGLKYDSASFLQSCK